MEDIPAPDFALLASRAGTIFTPAVPINAMDLFAGREDKVRVIVDVINQSGQHAVLYGERGVGKTSLANILSTVLNSNHPSRPILAPHVYCDSRDTFESVWRKVFEIIKLTKTTKALGFGENLKLAQFTTDDVLGAPGTVTVDSVRRALTVFSETSVPVVIVDEFDRLSPDGRLGFADLIKTLSDNAVRATVVVVGVGDSVEQLIADHRSVERSLVQVKMPRMSASEIATIIRNGMGKLGMEIDAVALNRIAKIAVGFPHYAHLLGLNSSRAALAAKSLLVDASALDKAIDQAIAGAMQTIINEYTSATRSAQKANIFSDVLLACALTEPDESGFFSAKDVRGPLRQITKKPYEIPAFASHLQDFCDKRGPVLEKHGRKRIYRYRFIDPLLQPYVLMQGLRQGKISSLILDPMPGQASLRFPLV